ncbi:major facilitator superfamily domain-containing protein [Chiua virens]|nr:major facilitator superfamily domain-containing protein [Chiua virens]
MEMLILARFLSGMGGGGIQTTSSIVISDIPGAWRKGFKPYSMVSVWDLEDLLEVLLSDWFGWRWAFIMQLPLFALSLILTTYNLRYVTPGKARSTKDILKRIDWGGSFTLLVAVFLSMKFNEDYTWDDPWVILPLALACVFFVIFILVELLVAPEPVLAPSLLKQRVPVLVGTSNFLVSLCNFSVMYFFPMWFQTVSLTSASVAGLHLLPNSVCMSIGSLFAGWMMHRTGKYKMMNVIFGFFPFVGIVLITLIHENSGPLQTWFSIIPLGFGNAVVLQTTMTQVYCTEHSIAVGTGFGQVFRGIGQVSGVAVSSALFQSKLNAELHARIHGPDADELHSDRSSAAFVTQRRSSRNSRQICSAPARDSYAVSLRAVFFLAACSTLMAYIVRLPIPEKSLGYERKKVDDIPDASQVEAQATPSSHAVHPDDDGAGEEGTKSVQEFTDDAAIEPNGGSRCMRGDARWDDKNLGIDFAIWPGCTN